jgi:hypothetical protein
VALKVRFKPPGEGQDSPSTCCPALIAEDAQIKAENAVLDALGDFLGQHISYSMRKQALELCCQLALARE